MYCTVLIMYCSPDRIYCLIDTGAPRSSPPQATQPVCRGCSTSPHIHLTVYLVLTGRSVGAAHCRPSRRTLCQWGTFKLRPARALQLAFPLVPSAVTGRQRGRTKVK